MEFNFFSFREMNGVKVDCFTNPSTTNGTIAYCDANQNGPGLDIIRIISDRDTFYFVKDKNIKSAVCKSLSRDFKLFRSCNHVIFAPEIIKEETAFNQYIRSKGKLQLARFEEALKKREINETDKPFTFVYNYRYYQADHDLDLASVRFRGLQPDSKYEERNFVPTHPTAEVEIDPFLSSGQHELILKLRTGENYRFRIETCSPEVQKFILAQIRRQSYPY